MTNGTYNFIAKEYDTEESTTCLLFSGTSWKCTLVIATKRTACSLSIIGCVFVLFLIMLFKKYRESSQRMIGHLALAEFLVSLTMNLQDIQYEATVLCKIQGALLNLFGWNTCLWIICIMLNMYCKLLFTLDISKYEKVITVICWLFPVLVMVLPFIDDVYGPAGVWCWITNDWRWRLGVWYCLRFFSLLVLMATTIHMTIFMHRFGKKRVSTAGALDNVKEDIRTLRAYPIVYFFFNLFPVINRIHNAVTDTADQQGYIFAFIVIQSICDPSFGAAVALCYVLDSRTRSKLTRKHLRDAVQRWQKESSNIQEFSMSSCETGDKLGPKSDEI